MVIKFSKHPFRFWGENNIKPSNINTWTSIYDIGKYYRSKKLTEKRYFQVENKCFLLIKRFVQVIGIPYLKLTGVECRLLTEKSKEDERITGASTEHAPFHQILREYFVYENKIINLEKSADLEFAVKMITRELFWARLEGPDNSFVHIGYDMYYYIGSDRLTSINQLNIPSGIYAKEIEKSPYSVD